MKQKNEKINKQVFKKNEEELQQYLMFKRRGSKVQNKKGKEKMS